MTKLKVQAQHLQPGDIVGSGEVVSSVILNSISWPSRQCLVRLNKRDVLWGKYTMIAIERKEKEKVRNDRTLSWFKRGVQYDVKCNANKVDGSTVKPAITVFSMEDTRDDAKHLAIEELQKYGYRDITVDHMVRVQ